MASTDNDIDVLIVGGGLMGAAVARQVREVDPHARIVMVDAGPDIGSIPGEHMHDAVERDIWERYNARMASGIQSHYAVSFPDDFGSSTADAQPGMYSLAGLGEQSEQMPVAALAWNAGGMGVHWSAATPWAQGSEVPSFLPAHEWSDDLATAQRLLLMNSKPYSDTEFSTTVRGRLNELLADRLNPSRPVTDMPMASPVAPDGRLMRTGPNRIFEPIRTGADRHFRRLTNTLATSVEVSGGRALGAHLRSTVTGETSEVRARTTVVCADAIRTPQLLFASGVRPEALGCFLNEHVALSGQVLVDLPALGLDGANAPVQVEGELGTAQYWVPFNEEQLPGMGQIFDNVFRDDEGGFLGYGCGVSFYVPTEVRRENRLEFSETEVDVTGMPRIAVQFSYTEADRARVDSMRKLQQTVCEQLGDFDSDRDSTELGPGASLHFTGTVRMGVADDGDSVCDTNGAVWGVDGLYVAGNGVIPTGISCNSTMTGMTTAVRAARAVARR